MVIRRLHPKFSRSAIRKASQVPPTTPGRRPTHQALPETPVPPAPRAGDGWGSENQDGPQVAASPPRVAAPPAGRRPTRHGSTRRLNPLPEPGREGEEETERAAGPPRVPPHARHHLGGRSNERTS